MSHDGQTDLVSGEQPGGLLPGHGSELDLMLMVYIPASPRLSLGSNRRIELQPTFGHQRIPDLVGRGLVGCQLGHISGRLFQLLLAIYRSRHDAGRTAGNQLAVSSGRGLDRNARIDEPCSREVFNLRSKQSRAREKNLVEDEEALIGRRGGSGYGVISPKMARGSFESEGEHFLDLID